MKFLSMLLVIIFIQGCKSAGELVEEEAPCPTVACTLEFRQLSVQFVNVAGQQVPVRNVEATFKESKKVIPGIVKNEFGYYIIADDLDKKIFSEKGDVIIVQAVDLNSAKTISSEFVISGGRCACHIAKISGNENILFN